MTRSGNSIASLDVPMDGTNADGSMLLRASEPPAPGRAALDSARPIPLNRGPRVLFRATRISRENVRPGAALPGEAPGRVPTPVNRCNRRAGSGLSTAGIAGALLATMPGAELPAHVKRKDWVLMAPRNFFRFIPMRHRMLMSDRISFIVPNGYSTVSRCWPMA